MWFRLRRILAPLCLWVALGCASSGDRPMHPDHLPGTWYFVEAGETPVSIAKRAGIPLDDFLEINGIHRNDPLEPGRPVFLFGSTKGLPKSEPDQAAAQATPEPAAATPAPPSGKAALLRWPLAAPRLTSRFGKRWGRPHEGIDMAAPIGTPVYAAAAGSVIYSGDQVRGYGNMVVLKHKDGLVTVYAHNSRLLVRSGEQVAVGQEIARVGDTGRSTGPHLHFEVRRQDVPVDPIPFLPALQ
jgi:murein DD-endopeptidase MepM/ murein hydrolase activator NlpD